MIGNIINTIGSRLLIALISLSILLLNSNFLGANGLGSVGLIILGVTIILLVSNFVSGGGLIYYAPRHSTKHLFLISYSWIIVTGLIFIPIILFTPLFIKAYAWDVLFLGILLSASSTNNHLLLGKEKVKQFNAISIIQALIQITALCYFFFVEKQQTVRSFVNSAYLAYFASFLFSLIMLMPYLKDQTNSSEISIKNLYKKVLNYGFYLQLANIFQLLNYRLSYFILQVFSGRAAVGIFTAGIQLSEGMLLPSRSLAMVQYARISNMNDDTKSVELSIVLMKVAFFITLPLVGILLLIPEEYFTIILGKDFTAVKGVIAAMSIGIIGLSMEGILSRFFSGTGRQKTNTINGLIGLVSTVGFGFWLIPIYGVMGAAYTASISYCIMLLFMLFQINKFAKISYKAYLPNQSDLDLARKEFRKYLKKSN